jgi:heme/copper-type cytochrome/quinol oxidase subunit 2
MQSNQTTSLELLDSIKELTKLSSEINHLNYKYNSLIIMFILSIVIFVVIIYCFLKYTKRMNTRFSSVSSTFHNDQHIFR